ncbi:MAG: FtsW/RodA/SpoVE family cell cycle protein [Verrucomicrobiota bacterium]
MTPLFRKFLGHNWILTFVVIGLAVTGVLSIDSATYFRGDEDAELLTKPSAQMMWLGVGCFFYIMGIFIDYRWLKFLVLPLFAAAMVLLAMVPLTSFGVTASGATSWLNIGGVVTIQPSQVALAGGILLMAFILGVLPKWKKYFDWTVVKLALCGAVAIGPLYLILQEPDQGSAAAWFAVTGAMFLVGGIPFRYLIVGSQLGLIAAPVLYFFVLKDYQRERIDTFIAMATGGEYDRQDEGWVPEHNLIALGSAGWMGKGYKGNRTIGERTIKEMGIIPANVSINDFIFVVFAEEQGYRGVLVLVGGYALLLLTLLTIAFHSRDNFGRLIVTGLAAQIFFHVFMNIGGSAVLVPITGVPLPLFSYGGTFAVVIVGMLGIAQSVWVHRNELIEQKEKVRGEFRG